jgi:hypothetical protein
MEMEGAPDSVIDATGSHCRIKQGSVEPIKVLSTHDSEGGESPLLEEHVVATPVMNRKGPRIREGLSVADDNVKCGVCRALMKCALAQLAGKQPMMSIWYREGTVQVDALEKSEKGLIRWYPLQESSDDGLIICLDDEERVEALLFCKKRPRQAFPDGCEQGASEIIVHVWNERPSGRTRTMFYQPPEGVRGLKACMHCEDMTEVLRKRGLTREKVEELRRDVALAKEGKLDNNGWITIVE